MLLRQGVFPFLQVHTDKVVRVGSMSGRDPRAVENELFYEESGTLRIFLPEAAVGAARIVVCFQSCSGSFPCTVEHPISGI